MQESTLYRVSLCCGLFGILALALISSFIEIEEKDISRITAEDVEKDLKVIGTITKLKEMDGMILLTVRHSSKIEVVLFEDDNIFSVGDRVSVSGKIEEYKDSYEIIGDSIELVG